MNSCDESGASAAYFPKATDPNIRILFEYWHQIFEWQNKMNRTTLLQAADIRTHVTELYAKFFTLPVNELYKLRMATVMHKFYHHIKILTGVCHNCFTRNSELHRYSTRQQSDLHVCRVNSALGQRSLKTRGCSIWNGLPTSLKELYSVKCFWSKLKQYLMTKLTEYN
jgi:hypothetical protein